MYKNRKVKKLKRQRPRSLMRGPDSGSADLRAYSWAVNGAAVQGRSRRGDRYGLDAHPCLRYRDGGSRAAGAERISGRGKPHPEEPVEWAIEALGRRASHAREDRSSPGPPSPCRGRNCREAGHHPCLVSRAYRRYLRWQTAGYREVEQLIVRMDGENRDWGYDRIVGALPNLGYVISGQTVGNIPHRHALPPAPERRRTTTWPAFIRTHLALLAGTDFFTVEVLTLRGLVTYYVLFFIHLESRRVDIAGITIHPDEPWMRQ